MCFTHPSNFLSKNTIIKWWSNNIIYLTTGLGLWFMSGGIKYSYPQGTTTLFYDRKRKQRTFICIIKPLMSIWNHVIYVTWLDVSPRTCGQRHSTKGYFQEANIQLIESQCQKQLVNWLVIRLRWSWWDNNWTSLSH
jgi:hypothetical protein